MAREVVGVVRDILDTATDRGKEYVVLRIDKEGYFDWNGLTAKKHVKQGDGVCLRVGGGRWPGVYDLEKLPAEKTPCPASYARQRQAPVPSYRVPAQAGASARLP